MFELGTTEHWWETAKRYPILSNHPNTLKPLGYAHIIMLIEAFKPKTILEVGHGSTSFIFKIFKKDIEIWGLDDKVEDSAVSEEDLKNMKSWNPNIKFVSGLLGDNVEELPDNYFDLIYSVSVIEHIPEDKLPSAFEETYRILKPGGIVSHCYDICYKQNTKPIFDAYENSKLEWLKPKDTMNVFWEEWMDKFDMEEIENIFGKIIFENPMIVAETYMWQQLRKNRSAPKNYLTVLTAAKKPLNGLEFEKVEDNKNNDIELKESNPSNKFVSPENLNDFTYSKKRHFNIFAKNNYDEELLDAKVDPDYCDVKTYQDLLIYSFIKHNIDEGARILDVGGDSSPILKYFINDYECWNVNKIENTESVFNGIHKEGYKFVNDHIGNFNKELHDNYFDVVFSASTFGNEAVEDKKKFDNILNDINRILKPDGYSIHCIVSVCKEPLGWISPIIPYFYKSVNIINEFMPLFKTCIDSDLFYMPEKYYADKWQFASGKKFSEFGKPFSYNLFWKKPAE